MDFAGDFDPYCTYVRRIGRPRHATDLRSVRMNPPWLSEAAVERAGAIFMSYRRWTGHDLLATAAAGSDLANALYEAPFILVAHGTEEDPVLDYGNRAALNLWEMDWQALVRTPSRLTAEPLAREERSRLLAEVTRHGFTSHYEGVRISSSGRRFRIIGATVWNVEDSGGRPAGQAAMFHQWEFL